MNRWQRPLYQPNLPLGQDGQRVTACKEHRALAKQAAKEGMVLLKNDGQFLPLEQGARIALFGKGSFDYVKGGGGSGDVTVEYVTNLYDGFKELTDRVSVYEALSDFYRTEVSRQYAEGVVPGMTEEPELPENLCLDARNFTDTAVISISRFSGEGWDRKSKFDAEEQEPDTPELDGRTKVVFEDGDFYLTHGEMRMVNMVKRHFSRIVVVLNVGGMVDSGWFAKDDQISSVLMAWQGGMEGGRAAAELLCGIGTPSGKLSDTFARNLEDYPSSSQFHESEAYVDYAEDIYVGYRYFETIPMAAEKVFYPFGYGMSYTTFDWSVTDAVEQDGSVRIRVQVTNTGDFEGKEVIQVYMEAPQGKLGKPAKCLAAFQKTRLLQPGESQLLTLTCSVSAMASYDDIGKVALSAYVLEKGTYRFYVGNSVRHVSELDVTYFLAEDVVTEQLERKLAPTSLSRRMLADGTWEELPQETPHDPDEDGLVHMTAEEAGGLAPSVRALDRYYLWKKPDEHSPHLFRDVAEGRMDMDAFLAQLTDADLAHLLGGQPNTGVANTYGFGNMPEYGIPNIMTADGPAGLRIHPECGVNTTAWPCATLIACTWNPEMARRIGAAGAREVKESNISVWLTPAVNIHRSPLCGRNFEYYSEDPLLTGIMAAAMVKGIQSQHIAATVKHFALNNKETNRKNSDSRVSERAAREIYLKAFEIIVKEADPWCIMTSYNIINGHRASENRELITDILRKEWGFRGMVTTDWWTYGEHYKETKAGNDMKMACGFPERLLQAKEAGLLSREEMEACARRILQLILKID